MTTPDSDHVQIFPFASVPKLNSRAKPHFSKARDFVFSREASRTPVLNKTKRVPYKNVIYRSMGELHGEAFYEALNNKGTEVTQGSGIKHDRLDGVLNTRSRAPL